MEITIKINGRMTVVEVSAEVVEYMDAGRRKAENLSHERRRHWDSREFDEYIVAAEGLLPCQYTPEDIVCQRMSAGNSGSAAVHSGHLHSNSAGALFALCTVRVWLYRDWNDAGLFQRIRI